MSVNPEPRPEPRESLKPDRAVLETIPTAEPSSTFSLVPVNLVQAMELSKLLSVAGAGVPLHCRNNPGICLRIVATASRFGIDPFLLADDSYVVTSDKTGDSRLAFGAKSIHAMVLRSGVVDGRLEIAFEGQGPGLTCTVSGRLRGSATVRTKTATLSDITIKRSPLWQSDPQQQLGYYCVRAWGRLHAPDALMGLLAREDPELEALPPPPPAAAGPSSDLARVQEVLAAGMAPANPEADPPAGTPEPNGETSAESEQAAEDALAAALTPNGRAPHAKLRRRRPPPQTARGMIDALEESLRIMAEAGPEGP
jgi:hypothetical protein